MISPCSQISKIQAEWRSLVLLFTTTITWQTHAMGFMWRLRTILPRSSLTQPASGNLPCKEWAAAGCDAKASNVSRAQLMLIARFNGNTFECLESCSGAYDDILLKMGPQSYSTPGVYVLRPALFLWVGSEDWAIGQTEDMEQAKLALVESAHPSMAREL